MFVGATTDIVPDEKPTYSNEKHIECLAMNMYHEARNQGTAGRLAVSAVVMNRVNDRRFPNSVCEVVLQSQMKKSWKTGLPVPIKNKCQFSWYCDGKSDEIKNKFGKRIYFPQVHKILNRPHNQQLLQGI